MTADVELLPCPFCGGKDIGDTHVQTYSLDSSYDIFGCKTCGANFECGSAREWNTRATATQESKYDDLWAVKETYREKVVVLEQMLEGTNTLCEKATAKQAAEIEALRTEVERLQSAFEQAVEADKDEEVQRLHAEKVAHFIARTDAEAEVKALRAEVERAERLCSVRTDETVLLLNRAERLAETLRGASRRSMWMPGGMRICLVATDWHALMALLRDQEEQ